MSQRRLDGVRAWKGPAGWVALLALFANGCVYLQGLPTEQRMNRVIVRPAVAEPDFFAYRVEPMQLHLERRLLEEREDYLVWSLVFPSAGESGQPDDLIRAHYYQSRLPGRKKLLISLPVYGKSLYPAQKISSFMTRPPEGPRDTNVLLFLTQKNLFRPDELAAAPTEEAFLDEIRATVERIRATVVDIRRMIDWAETQPDLDPGRIGIIGFSFSSIVANLAMAADERIGAGVLFLGGGHLHKIFAYCNKNDIAKSRSVLAERFGWTNLTFERKLRDILGPIDPVPLAWRLRNRPVLLGESLTDHVIPPESKSALWMALGKPPRLRFVLGHRAAFLSMTKPGFNYANKKIQRFFEESLCLRGPGGACGSQGPQIAEAERSEEEGSLGALALAATPE